MRPGKYLRQFEAHIRRDARRRSAQSFVAEGRRMAWRSKQALLRRAEQIRARMRSSA